MINRSHPASTVSGLSKTDDVPENILAFRSITSLLEHLPRARPAEAKKDAARSQRSRRRKPPLRGGSQWPAPPREAGVYRSRSVEVSSCLNDGDRPASSQGDAGHFGMRTVPDDIPAPHGTFRYGGSIEEA